MIPPSHLVARAGPNTVDLSWRDNSSNEAGFRIERSYIAAEGPFVQVSQVPINIVRWTNYGVLANKTMWYRVRVRRRRRFRILQRRRDQDPRAGRPGRRSGNRRPRDRRRRVRRLAGRRHEHRLRGPRGGATTGVASALTGGVNATGSPTGNPFSDLLV